MWRPAVVACPVGSPAMIVPAAAVLKKEDGAHRRPVSSNLSARVKTKPLGMRIRR